MVYGVDIGLSNELDKMINGIGLKILSVLTIFMVIYIIIFVLARKLRVWKFYLLVSRKIFLFTMLKIILYYFTIIPRKR